ncbi:MAG: TetR/AcrR family transcriptional regulator [Solirubrobacteraceae bacterium]
MPRNAQGPPAAQAPPAARRLARGARRRQLLAAALPLVARHGFADFSLDGLSERVGVTRNLLYHYFPRGRADVVLAVVRESRRQLSTGTEVSSPLPIPPQMVDHALAPTHAWRIYRLARATADPEIRDIVEDVVDGAVRALADQAGIESPSVLTQVALRGYVAFAESLLDEARAAGIPRQDVVRVLGGTLAAIVPASR